MTVGRLRRELSPNELVDWQAFARMVPFTDERDFRADVRAATICAHVLNPHRKRGYRMLTAKDFLWNWRAKAPQLMKAQSPAVLKAKLKAAFAAMGKGPPSRK